MAKKPAPQEKFPAKGVAKFKVTKAVSRAIGHNDAAVGRRTRYSEDPNRIMKPK